MNRSLGAPGTARPVNSVTTMFRRALAPFCFPQQIPPVQNPEALTQLKATKAVAFCAPRPSGCTTSRLVVGVFLRGMTTVALPAVTGVLVATFFQDPAHVRPS